MSIENNLKIIQNTARNAAEKSGRNFKDITILGVTKTIDVERINQLVSLGINNLGENRVQEFITKFDKVEKNVNWHLIGHLQSNKIKYIMSKVSLIHSVDSIKLAEEIDRLAKKSNLIQDILLEINIAGEETKNGVSVANVEDLLTKIADLSSIRVRGLMTVAPFVENGEENREYFRKMRYVFLDLNSKFYNNITMDVLSMGMSSDYKVAIEEGATMVRIGQGLFGKR